MPTDPFFANKKSDVKNQGVKKDNRLSALFEKLNCTRPSCEIILDDWELRLYLNISKRTSANQRAKGLIEYSQPVPKGKVYYTLQNIVDFIASGRKPTISSKRKI